MYRVSTGLFSAMVFGLVLLLVGTCLGDIELRTPDLEVTEGDRRVDMSWQDPSPEDLVVIEQPVLGSISFPWDGNATLSTDGFYTGACDWTYSFLVSIVLGTVEFSWQEVIDWRLGTVENRRLTIQDVETYYDLSDGLRVKVDSAGLFAADTVGWNGPVPWFHGVYRGGTFTQTSDPDTFDFTCTAGGEVNEVGGSAEFEWLSNHGESGSFMVTRADTTVSVFQGFKATFPAGTYYAGESFSVEVLMPVGDGSRFTVRVKTFGGYLVLRRSVEDRSGMYKVRANISKCDTFEFFQDENGDPDPYGVRSFVDEGIVEDAPGVNPDPRLPTVINGFPYEYLVVTYDLSEDHKQILSPFEEDDWRLVYPSVPPASGVDDVFVVPNPYIGRAGWETGEAKVMFMNIPRGAEIRIYDAAGGYVRTIGPNTYSYDDTEPQGSAQWDLRNGDGDDVVSGIYIYMIESNDGNKAGRFIVVR